MGNYNDFLNGTNNDKWIAYTCAMEEIKALKDKLHRRNMQIEDLKKEVRELKEVFTSVCKNYSVDGYYKYKLNR